MYGHLKDNLFKWQGREYITDFHACICANTNVDVSLFHEVHILRRKSKYVNKFILSNPFHPFL